MHRIRCVALLAAVTMLLLLAVASAQEWVKKPFQQWSKSDVEKVLGNSPWAKTQEVRELPLGLGELVAATRDLGTSRGASSGDTSRIPSTFPGLNESSFSVDFKSTLTLWSALPVRQAIVRSKQLQANYDKMGDTERAAFDAGTKSFLDCPECADNIIITLTSKSINHPGSDAIYLAFKDQTLSTLKDKIFIANDRGEQRQMVRFVRPRRAMEPVIFFFPRLDDAGRPLLTSSDKNFQFRIKNTGDNSLVNFKFDVSKLVFGGAVAF